METAIILMIVFITCCTFCNMYMTYRCQHNYEFMQTQNDKFKDRMYEMMDEMQRSKYDNMHENEQILCTIRECIQKSTICIHDAMEKIQNPKKEEPKKLNWRQKKKLKEGKPL